MRLTALILNPPTWSDEYYRRKKGEEQLDQVVDTPYLETLGRYRLIQLADVLAFFLRRYVEMKEQLVPAKYSDEQEGVDGWIELLRRRSIGTSFIYPKKGRVRSESLFYDRAPKSIRDL